MPKHKVYSREFKEEAVRLWQESDKSAAEVEGELDLKQGTLYTWKYRLSVKERKAEAAGEAGSDEVARRRIRQLERENERLRQERDILKKVVAIYSRTPK